MEAVVLHEKWVVPTLIETKNGIVPSEELLKRVGCHDDENETAFWIEFYAEGDLVHRSAHTLLKKVPSFTAEQAEFS